jgi:hypothetical protein
MARLPRRLALAACCLAAMAVGAGRARAEVPAAKQALIVLRILAYDHALAERAGDTVRVAVVHGEGSDSLRCASSMRSAFDKLVGRAVVNGRGLAVVSMSVREMVAGAAQRHGAVVVYVCAGVDRDVQDVARAARAAGALSFTDMQSYLERGLSIALLQGDDRVAISVNLVAARAEGARLAGQFLKLSKVVKQ